MIKRKKGQRDKQRSTKHTHKTKDRVTRTPLITFIMYTKSRNNGKPNNFKKARKPKNISIILKSNINGE